MPMEVWPMARSAVARETMQLGGAPEWRADFVTDNGNCVIDVAGLDLTNPPEMESRLNNIPGVVSVGLFALRPANRLLVASDSGITALSR